MGIENLFPAEWARSVVEATPFEFTLGVGFAALLSAGGLWGLIRFIRRVRLIEDTPTSRVRSAAQGYVELVGRGELMPGPPVISPLTGTTCTWYSYRIEERVRSGGRDDSTRWRTIQSGTSESLFLLVDETGECIVDPEGAEVTPSSKNVWYGNSSRWFGPPPSSRGLFGGGRFRFTERRMLPGDPLYAIGLFRSVGGATEIPDLNEEVRALLRAWKRDQAALVSTFDSDGDGQIDMEEWETVRRAAHQEVLKNHAERARAPASNLMERTHDSRRPYLLSVLPQQRMVRRFRLYAALSALLFLLAGTATVWMVTVRLG